MVRIFRQVIATFLSTVALLAQSPAQAHDHPVDDLLDLPHPMRVLKRADWQERLDPEQ